MNRLELNKSLFDQAIKKLTKQDHILKAVIQKFGAPPFWQRPPGFATLIQIILEQQVSLASAKAVFTQLKEALRQISARAIQQAGGGGLRQLGVTRPKARYCYLLAEQVESGKSDFEYLHQLDNQTALAYLCQLKGVGRWTAEVYLLMAMRRADIFPAGDLVLIKAISQLYQLDGQSETEKLRQLSETWKPNRAVAAHMLWHYYLSQ